MRYGPALIETPTVPGGTTSTPHTIESHTSVYRPHLQTAARYPTRPEGWDAYSVLTHARRLGGMPFSGGVAHPALSPT